MKVVINCCYGGFSLSEKAMETYILKKGWEYKKMPPAFFNTDFMIKKEQDQEWNYFDDVEIHRSDPDLLSTIEELGLEESNGSFAELRVVEIPDDIEWELSEYDGIECVAEVHRRWC